jgi:spermidine/putrescine transport system permease protein
MRRPPRLAAWRRRTLHRWAAAAFVAIVLLFLFLPIVLIVVFSFNSSPTLSFPIHGFTLGWYREVFSDPLFVTAFKNSLELAGLTAVVAGLLGTTAAFAVGRFGRRLQSGITYAVLVPSILPVLVIAIALAVFLNAIGFNLSLRTAAIGHILIAFPFVFLILRARLESFDYALLEAARDSGASPLRAFRDITLPLVRPSIIGAALISISLSLDEFVITSFTIGPDQTLPVLIWAKLRLGLDPGVNALATLVLSGTLVAGMISYRLSRIRL